jgi:O-antigen ligase
MSKLEFYLNKIVHYGLYAILLTPLVFWPKALYPFLTPKFLLFQILVEIVFSAWLILKLLKSDFKDALKSDFNNWLVIALALFIAISFVSAISGVDFSRSFWGIGARMTGLFAELHFLAWFLVLASVFRSGSARIEADQRGNYPRESARNLRISASTYLNFSFFVAIAIALTAFYQNLNWSLAIGSTIFNNPTFVAPYFIFHFFWGLYQILNSKFQIPNSKKWFYGAGTVLLFITIILTQIRGAILGLLAGIFAFGIILIFTSVLNRRAKIALIVCYLAFIAGIIGFWNIRDFPVVKNISFLNKISQTSLMETTVQTRLLDWQTAITGFKDQPLLGVGPENYNYVFDAHYNPRFLKFGGTGFDETWSDKPHNAFLEILAENGIIGSLAYLFIWIAAALAIFKFWCRSEKILAAALSSAFIAYVGAIFFSFDSFGSWFGLFLFLAFLASHNNANKNEDLRMPRIANIYSQLASLVILLAALALLWINLSIWRANLADADALRIFGQNTGEGITLFKKSLSYFTPYKAEYQFDLIASVIGAIQKNISLPDLENNLNFTLDSIDGVIAAHPYNAAYYSDAAKLYNILGEKGRDPAILAQAEMFAKESLKLSPNRQEIMFYLAQTALIRGDTETAIQWTEKAVEVDPTIRQSHWYLGRLYFVAGRYQNAAVEIKKALELGYRPQNKAEEEFIKNLGL